LSSIEKNLNSDRRCLLSTIAIDGPAASGKSTVGRALANRLHYLFLDTGVMYRAVTWIALKSQVPISNEAAVSRLAHEVSIEIVPPTIRDGRQNTVTVDGLDVTWSLRAPEIDSNVSQVSAYAGVREALTAQQKKIGARGHVVMVGRDIGTVVLPQADLKIYLTATLAERAKRRLHDLQERGQTMSYEVVLEDMRRRDKIDSERALAPLQAADDAVVLDTTDCTIEQTLDDIQRLADRVYTKKSPCSASKRIFP